MIGGTTRRRFLHGAAAIAAAGFPMPALAQAKPKLVVIGGGPGGATIAKYVAKDSDGGVEVTLIESFRQFTTCFHSNLYLGGFRTWDSINHSYDAWPRSAASRSFTRRRRQSTATARPSASPMGRRRPSAGGRARHRHQVRLGAGLFEDLGGHAARVEAGTADPAAQAATRGRGGRRGDRHDRAAQSLSLPARAYERASMMAHVLKAKGYRRARIVILDPKETFSKQALFQEGWEKHYPAWWNGRTRRCTAASSRSIPRP